jgi:hypothetical protein
MPTLLALIFSTTVSAAAAPTLVTPPNPGDIHAAVAPPEGVKLDTHQAWELQDLANPAAQTPVQLAPAVAADGTAGAQGGCLLFDILGGKDAAQARRFRLQQSQPREARLGGFTFLDLDGKSLRIDDSGRPVLTFNHATVTNDKVPKKDGRRSRACYLHPVWGLDGEVLTDDFPKDHYHHHGVFWTWPHVGIGGKEYSLWENKGIRPEFVRWLHRSVGPVAAVLAFEDGWFVDVKKVMIERVWLRVGKAIGDQRSLDLDFTWIPVDRPITLRGAEGKSYGGLTVRLAVRNPKDARITVPSGLTKDDLPDTPLAWADLTTKFDGAAAPSGAAIFVPRDHPDYPPTWLTRHYGPLCVGWPGVKDRTFEPGRQIHLAYRIWIHRQTVGADDLKRAYDAYTATVKWE